MKRRWSFLLLLFVSCAPLHLANEIDSIEYYIDETSTETLASIQKVQWTQSIGPHLNFGFKSNATYWMKFDISAKHDVIVDIEYPSLNSVTFYFFKRNQFISQVEVGESTPRHLWPINYRSPSVMLPKGNYVAYAKVKSTGTLDMPVFVMHYRTFIEFASISYLFLGMYYGITLGLVMYNLTIAIFSRSLEYLYYSLATLGVTLFSANLHGTAYQYLWPTASLLWIEKSAWVGIFSYATFNLLFFKSFVGHARFTKTAHVLYRINWVLTSVLWTCFVFLPHEKIAPIAPGILLLYFFLMVMLSSLFLFQKETKVIYIVVATTASIAMMIVHSLARYKVIPFNLFTNYGFQISLALEAVLFSIALAHKQKKIQEQLNTAKLEAEAILQQKFTDFESANKTLRETHLSRESEVKVAGLAQQLYNRQFPISLKTYQIEGFLLSADKLSGDFFFEKHDQKKLLCILGDVSGHGIQAAMIMMAAGSIFEHCFLKNFTTSCGLEDVYIEAQMKLQHLTQVDSYITITLVELEFETGNVRIINAGNHPVLIKHFDNDSLERIPSSSSVLGDSSFQYICQETTLRKKSYMMFYTDGIVEDTEVNADLLLETFKMMRTREELKIIVDSAKSHFQGLQLIDDASLVVIGRF